MWLINDDCHVEEQLERTAAAYGEAPPPDHRRAPEMAPNTSTPPTEDALGAPEPLVSPPAPPGGPAPAAAPIVEGQPMGYYADDGIFTIE